MVQQDYNFWVFMVWNDAPWGNQKWILMCFNMLTVILNTTTVYVQTEVWRNRSLIIIAQRVDLYTKSCRKGRKNKTSFISVIFISCASFVETKQKKMCFCKRFSLKITAPDSSACSSPQAITEKPVRRGKRREMKVANTGNDLWRLQAW